MKILFSATLLFASALIHFAHATPLSYEETGQVGCHSVYEHFLVDITDEEVFGKSAVRHL